MTQTHIPIVRLTQLTDKTLKDIEKEVDIFKIKEKMTLEEMKNNVEKLNEISISLATVAKELEVCE